MIRYILAAALVCGCSTFALAKDQAQKDADREKPLAGPWLGQGNNSTATPAAAPQPAAAGATVQAQPGAAPAANAPVVAMPAPISATANSDGIVYLPANTEVTVAPNDEISSKTLRKGDVFTVSVVYDVMLNGYIVIPRGARGQGEVTWRSGKGAFGKSAKMDIVFTWIEVGGRRVAVEGKRRLEGQGNTGATIGAVVAVGVFGGFVTGKSAIAPRGTQFGIHTTEAIPVRLAAAQPAPQQAAIVPPASGVTQGTTPASAPAGAPVAAAVATPAPAAVSTAAPAAGAAPKP